MSDHCIPTSWARGSAIALIAYIGCAFHSWGAAAGNWRIREEKTVVVDGEKEIWQLRWLSKPATSCGAEDAEISLTCPCSG